MNNNPAEDKRGREKVMKKIILLLLTVMLIVTLLGCNNDLLGKPPIEKQIPIYTGMTIEYNTETAINSSKRTQLVSYTNNGNGNDGDNGNHNGQGNDKFDADGGEYFADRGEDIYIHIHFDNPDNFEIMSFTINGKKYSSYMFEDGSNMETIIIKIQVGNESGTYEYIIDEIKYVDGTKIKFAIIKGNTSIKVHVSENEYVGDDIESDKACKHDDLSQIVYIEAKAPTCKEVGYTEGVKCNQCGYMLTVQETIPKSEQHIEENIPAVEATCTQSGLSEGKKCSVCGTITVSQNVVSMKAHTEVNIPAVEATCTQSGFSEGKKCSVCGTITVSQNVVPMKAHTEVNIPAVEATCTETGLTEGKQCYICGVILVTQQIVPKLDHVESDWIIDIDSTKYEDGSKHTECTMCGKVNKTEILYAGSKGLGFLLIEDGTYVVINGVSCLDRDVVIPRMYNGKPVTGIGDKAFNDYDTRLVSITIPDSVTRIYDFAFAGCSSLTSIQIPDSVTSIGWGAFSDCTSLKSIEIPDSVTSTDWQMFERCTSLESVVIGNSVTSIGLYAFKGCTSLSNVVIGNSVTSIDNEAFYGCTSLTSIEIPNSVTSIGMYAFKGCTSLTSIKIPDSVTNIGNNAFSGCTSLTNIEVDPNNQNYNSIDGNLYAKNGKTLIRYAIGKKATSFIISDSVTNIWEYAFVGCTSLTSIDIPDSVTNIDTNAFSGCTSLTTINFEGTVEQWNAIKLGSSWNYKVPATEVICSNGTVPIK